MLISNIRFAFSRHFLEVLGTNFAAFLSNHPIIQTPNNANQLTNFSTTQALTEIYFRTDHDIIYNKKYKRRGGYETANRSQTNAPITKDNDWNRLIIVSNSSAAEVAAIAYRSPLYIRCIIPLYIYPDKSFIRTYKWRP